MSALIIAAAGILVLVGFVLLAKALSGTIWWRLWRLWRTSRTAIALAATREVSEVSKLVGKVAVDDKVLIAPLTGRACACWSLTIDDLGSESGGRLVEARVRGGRSV